MWSQVMKTEKQLSLTFAVKHAWRTQNYSPVLDVSFRPQNEHLSMSTWNIIQRTLADRYLIYRFHILQGKEDLIFVLLNYLKLCTMQLSKKYISLLVFPGKLDFFSMYIKLNSTNTTTILPSPTLLAFNPLLFGASLNANSFDFHFSWSRLRVRYVPLPSQLSGSHSLHLLWLRAPVHDQNDKLQNRLSEQSHR